MQTSQDPRLEALVRLLARIAAREPFGQTRTAALIAIPSTLGA